MILEKFCSFIKDILPIYTRLRHWKLNNFLISRKILDFYSDFKGFLINFYHLKALENKELCKF